MINPALFQQVHVQGRGATDTIRETALDRGGLDDYGTRVYPGRKISLLGDQVEYLFTTIISGWIEETRTQYGGNL